MTELQSDIRAAIDAGLANAEPKPLNLAVRAYSVLVPPGGSHHTIDMGPYIRKYAKGPARPTGTYHPATVDALIDVIDRHRDPDASTVWVHPTSGQLVAVFNDNDGMNAAPGWRDHRAQLELSTTEEWRHWKSKDAQLLTQVVFAEHVEDGMTEIVSPPAADLLELAQTFQAKSDVNFRSAVRISSGEVQALYDETVDAKAGRKGQITIPAEFELAIAPFLGEPAYPIKARLRYRIREGNLVIGYKLDHPDRVLRDALGKIAERLVAKGFTVFVGEPGS